MCKPFAHSPITRAVVASVEGWLKNQTSLGGVVCTHKDLVKLPKADLGGVPLRALQIALQIQRGEKELTTRLQPFAALRD